MDGRPGRRHVRRLSGCRADHGHAAPLAGRTPHSETDSAVDQAGTVYASFDGERTSGTLQFTPFVTTVNIPSRDFEPPVNGGTFTVGDEIRVARLTGVLFFSVRRCSGERVFAGRTFE